MKCEQCGAEFQPSGRGKPQRFCSKRCRDRANYLRRRRNEPAPEYKPKPKAPVLNQREFDRMMDDSMEDVLRHTRDVLRKAMDDPGTRASDLPALSRQYIAVCRELESQSGGDPLADLLDEQEVSEDVGASVV